MLERYINVDKLDN